MYKVQWCDHEGNFHEEHFECLEEARHTAEYLRSIYDGVEIVPPSEVQPTLTINLTHEQLAHNIDLLTRLADLYGSEAAGLAKFDYPVAQELAEDRLDAIGYAQELIALLSEY